jgi:hypothetical protein
MIGVLMMAVGLLAAISSSARSLPLPPAPSPHIHCSTLHPQSKELPVTSNFVYRRSSPLSARALHDLNLIWFG